MNIKDLNCLIDYQVNTEQLIAMAKKEIAKNILPKIAIKKYKIICIYRKSDYLGYYEDGTCFNITTIKLNISCILKSAIKYSNISLYEIILSTIIHELGHALQELKEKHFNEKEAENFAYNYVHLSILNTI